MFPQADCREQRDLIDHFEAKLLLHVDGFLGHEIGPCECKFYVRGDYSEVSGAASEIAVELGLDPKRLAVRPTPRATSGKGRIPRAKPFEVFAVPLGVGTFGYVQFLAFEPDLRRSPTISSQSVGDVECSSSGRECRAGRG